MDDCIIFKGYKNPKGYGSMRYKGKTWRAHRAVWDKERGEIPKGMHVCHKCDNPSCVNIKHLFLGTNNDNMQDKINKGRQTKGTDTYSAKLNENAVRKIRKLSMFKFSNKDIAFLYDVNQSTVCRIVNNLIWRHVA